MRERLARHSSPSILARARRGGCGGRLRPLAARPLARTLGEAVTPVYLLDSSTVSEPMKRAPDGTPAPFVDGQIAAIAKCHDLILVTANVKDFRRLEGLRTENSVSGSKK